MRAKMFIETDLALAYRQLGVYGFVHDEFLKRKIKALKEELGEVEND